MIDYDRAEIAAMHLLRSLPSRHTERRCVMFRLACLVAVFEFALLVAGALYALE
jgi:hypothetical protein